MSKFNKRLKEVQTKKHSKNKVEEDFVSNKARKPLNKKSHVKSLKTYEKATFSLPIETIAKLERLRNKLRTKYHKDGPDKTHIVILALERFFMDVKGSEEEEMINKLLELKQVSVERKKRSSS